MHRTWAEIDISALIHNFKIIKQNADNSKVMAVVKANAYGHGVADIAPVLDRQGADCFAVSNIDEAVQLRDLGITKPVLILGYTPQNAVELLCKNNITQCVYSTDYAEKLSAAAVKKNLRVKIHIKLDTGMSRLGFDCRNDKLSGLREAVKAAKSPAFDFEGIFTHFAVSDRTPHTEDGFTNAQYARFEKAVEYFVSLGLNPKICHCCNSAAQILDTDKHLSLVRPGIILYGLPPSADLELEEDLIPVMTLKTVVSMVKEVSLGDTVSYGRTYKAEKPTKIATLTAGYADGYPRALSNKGYVLINGKKAPIVGRVCMDQMCVDVSEIENINVGDEVILFGKELPVENLASLIDTVNYEIICNISPRVPRVLVNGNE